MAESLDAEEASSALGVATRSLARHPMLVPPSWSAYPHAATEEWSVHEANSRTGEAERPDN